MKDYSTLDIYMEATGGSLLSLETVMQNVLDLLARKEYKQAEAFVTTCKNAKWGIKGASEASDKFHFNKALLHARKKSKQDPSREFIDFYLQVKPDSDPIAIKMAFYNKAVFRFMLANSDRVEAYVNKAVAVKPYVEKPQPAEQPLPQVEEEVK